MAKDMLRLFATRWFNFIDIIGITIFTSACEHGWYLAGVTLIALSCIVSVAAEDYLSRSK